MRQQRCLAIILVIICSLCLSSCASNLHVRLQAGKRINLSKQQQALPVTVKVLQLATIDRYKQADFRDLWLRTQATLGSQLLATRDIIVAPGTQTTITLKRKQDVKYVAVVAIFRQPAIAKWRAMKALGTRYGKAWQQVNINIEGNRISVY